MLHIWRDANFQAALTLFGSAPVLQKDFKVEERQVSPRGFIVAMGIRVPEVLKPSHRDRSFACRTENRSTEFLQ